jgi:hypothetical protein
MPDAVATQVILDGERLFIAKFTNISDGTGENKVLKIDASTLNRNSFGLACDGVKINKIWSTTHGVQIQIFWDATTDQFCWIIPQNSNYLMDFSSFGGLSNNAGAGENGDVLFSTQDASAGDSYAIVLECIKTYASA